MSKTTFVKIDTSARKDYFLQTTLKDDGKEGFQLMVTDGESVWSGDLTEDNIDSLSTKVKMDYHTYVTQTVKAFTQENMGGMQFEFLVKTRGDDSVDFIWKKHVPADEIKFQLGSVTLYEKDDTARCVRQMFQQCITNTTALQERIRSLNTDNERLSQERAKALKRLDKCVTAKEEVERDLYEKFVAVLNSKKEKIRALKRQIEEGLPSSVTDGPEPSTSGVSASRVSDESGDEDVENGVASSSRVPDSRLSEEENTDEESQPAPKRRRRGQISQSIKKEADTSLVLEDAADKEPATVARRPARQRAGNKKQTPSKPVLPKVTSKRSDSGLSEEENTDEESQPAPKRRRRGQISQSIKKEADTSLVLEDAADKEPATVARRPARQRAGNKKQTPSKPVLPKVTSKRSDSGSSGDGRRSSMRKSSSHSSNKSSDYQDPDELMADLE